MKDALAEYDLKVRYNEAPDSEPIDIIVYDDEDNVAFAWGSEPWKDVQVECNHPDQCIEYDDDEPVGRCALCGATCETHYEADNGNVEDYAWSGRRQVPTSWTMPEEPGGIIGDYLKDLQKRW